MKIRKQCSAQIILSIFLCCFTSAALAGGFTPVGEITNLYVSSTFVNVKLSGESYSPDNCTVKNGWYGLSVEDSNYQAMYSLILAAHYSGDRVKFYVAGCSGQSGSYPRIISIMTNQ